MNTRDIWVRQLFEAMGEFTPTVGIKPESCRWSWLFPQRAEKFTSGYAERTLKIPRRASGRLAPTLAPVVKNLIDRYCPRPDIVVFTRPDQRELVRHFRNATRVYYASDDFTTCYGWPKAKVLQWEEQILDQVDQVVTISTHLAELFADRYDLDAAEIFVSPNGLPKWAIPAACPQRPATIPSPVPNIRPLAGILGNVSSRLRLDWIRHAVDSLPWLQWVFVGTVTERTDIVEYLTRHPRCHFTGTVAYDEMFSYAASFDVAVIPLSEGGINPSASPVRFFSQLPFGQAIIATNGCQQLAKFEPLVQVCRDRSQFTRAFVLLRESSFNDGLREKRWQESQNHIWQRRARMLLDNVLPLWRCST